MTAKKKHTLKRWMILVLIVSLLGMIGYGAYRYYFISQEKKQQYTTEQQKEANEVLDKYNLSGDKDIAQEYTILVNDKDYDAANKLFSDRIKAAADDESRSALYKQHILLALASQLPDQALIVANNFIAFRPTHESYSEAARVYAVKFDFPKQIEFYQKALDDVKTRDIENKDEYIGYYEAKLSALKEIK